MNNLKHMRPAVAGRRLLLLLGILVIGVGCNSSAATPPAPTPGTAATTAATAAAGSVATPTPPEPTATAAPEPTATPAPTATPEPQTARFAIIGDYGMAGPPEQEVADLVKSWNPDFIVTTGDNNYPTGAAETIDANIGQYYAEFIHPYTGAYGPGAATNRFFPILGNHDLDIAGGQAYLDYFELPGNERYYSFTWEPIDFFMLNSMPGEPDGIEANSAQAEWLQQELAAADACWQLVFFHHPAYSSGHRGESTWMRWPFQEWGADAAFSGHNHVYERIMRDNFVYFVNGLGGGPRYAFAEALVPGSVAHYNQDHGAMLVEATGGTMTLQFVTRTDEVIDSYTMEKSCQ
ncbi:MAG: metallophosphoesterase family protein [Chloroflexaceae bacterium]